MKKIIAFTSFIVLTVSLFSQDLNYAKEIVNTLASPEFKGRGYVGNGNTIAADFIKDQFSKIGLKPFTKGYFQPFKIDVNIFPKNMELEVDGIALKAGEDFIVDPFSSSIDRKSVV